MSIGKTPGIMTCDVCTTTQHDTRQNDYHGTMVSAHAAGWIVCGINAADSRDVCPACQSAHGIQPGPQSVKCVDCHDRGPVSDTTVNAGKAATDAGWLYVPHLFPAILCPECAARRGVTA